MRVLYISHTGHLGGGERSLLDLIGALEDRAEPVLASPAGPLDAAARDRGVRVLPIAGTEGSLRLHPRHTTVALAEMSRAAFDVARAARRTGADVVHANSIRAGLIAVLAARAGAPPPVVHVRDILPPGRVSAATHAVLRRGSAALVANSAHTAAALGGEAGGPPVRVMYNPVDLRRFDPGAVDGAAARVRLGLPPEAFVATLVAQLTPWKGQVDAVRALAAMAPAVPHARLLLVGSAKFVSAATRFDNEAYVAQLRALIGELGVADNVALLGEREDVPEILAASDAVLLPSWEEPFGRAVVEAMAMGVPVLATSAGGPAEIIDDGVDGVLLPPQHPALWAAALRRLAGDPAHRARLGAAGRRRAETSFRLRGHADAMLGLYGEIAARPRGRNVDPGRSARASA